MVRSSRGHPIYPGNEWRNISGRMAGRIILGMPPARRSGVRCTISVLGLDLVWDGFLLFSEPKGNLVGGVFSFFFLSFPLFIRSWEGVLVCCVDRYIHTYITSRKK